MLRLRYGLDGEEMTYRDIAGKLGITGARITQLHDHALWCLNTLVAPLNLKK